MVSIANKPKISNTHLDSSTVICYFTNQFLLFLEMWRYWEGAFGKLDEQCCHTGFLMDSDYFVSIGPQGRNLVHGE
jgi:hypothetical protein